jgi:sugar/nucleoside kinase (ribokinase family)
MSTAVDARSPMHWPGLDGAPRTRFSLAVVGDVRVELRTELADRSFTELTEDHLGYAPVRAVVAGTAINLARHAVGYFRAITVIGRIGDDAFTPVIRQCLRDLGVTDRLSAEPGTPNGFSVMLRDRPASDRHGVRLLVAGDGAPSGRVSAADLHRSAAVVERADVLFVDGYALLSPVSRVGLRAAVRIARAAGTLVAFDLVPHDIHRRLPLQDVLPVLAEANVILTEVPTVAGLLDRPVASDADGARELLPALDQAPAGPQGRRPLWLLRFGATHLENALAYQRDRLLLEYPTGYGPGVQRTGYGDRLAVCELYWWLSRTR